MTDPFYAKDMSWRDIAPRLSKIPANILKMASKRLVTEKGPGLL